MFLLLLRQQRFELQHRGWCNNKRAIIPESVCGIILQQRGIYTVRAAAAAAGSGFIGSIVSCEREPPFILDEQQEYMAACERRLAAMVQPTKKKAAGTSLQLTKYES